MGVLGGGFLGGGFANGSSSGGGGSPSGPAGGIDVTGTYPNALDVVGLRGQPIAATVPTNGQVLTFNGTTWAPAAPAGGLPIQTGNEDKILTTDGSAASWTATLVDVALTGSAAAVEIQSLLDVNITAAGGLVGSFGDNVSLVTSNGTADFSGTGTVTIASVSSDVSISANSGIALATTAGIVSVPTVAYPNNTTAAASTAFVTSGLATKVDASGGTLASGTINGSTTLDGTLTASATALLDLDATGAEVRVPTVTSSDSSTKAASTAFVKAYMPAPGSAGNVPRSNGTSWVSTQLAVADVSGAAPLASPTFTASPTAPTPAATDNSTRIATTEWVVTREDPSRFVRWRDECLPGVIASTIQWAVAQNGASASVTANPAALTGAFGHRAFTTGTTNSGRAALSWETVAGQLPLVSPWTVGTLRLDWRVQLATLPTALEDFRFSLSLGTGAGTAGDDFTSGIGIRCDSTNANWVLASRVLASDVATQTLSFAVAAATWTWVILDLTSTTATVYMGATRAAALAAGSRGSVTMVGATGVPVGPMTKLRKTVGTTARLAYQEFHRGEIAITTPR